MNGFISMIIISALCLLVGILSIKSGIRKKKVCTELAVAKIVDVHVSYGDGKERNTYSPIYAFEINGQEYKGTIGQVSKKRKDLKKIRRNLMNIIFLNTINMYYLKKTWMKSIITLNTFIN